MKKKASTKKNKVKESSIKSPAEKVKTTKIGTKASDKKAGKDKCFMVVDGAVLSTIRELADALNVMSDDVFYYHANNERNDFSAWVADVFDEKKLAQDLTKAGTKDRAQIVLLRFFIK